MELDKQKYKEFEILYKENLKRLYYYATSLINDPESARDIVNDTYCFLWENYEAIVADNEVLPVLYTRIRSRCIDFLRHRKIESKYEQQVNEKGEAVFEEWEDYSEHQERLNRVMTYLEQLPPQTRLVFEECFLRGKKYKEVGEELGISPNTVKTYIMRALEKIRQQSLKLFFYSI